MTTRMVEANGLRIAVREQGEGEPVLLLHGFPDTARVWRLQMPALAAAGFRVIAPDMRGRGETEMPEGVEAYQLGSIVGDVVGLMDALGIERARVVGHDWGAISGWFLSMMHPERVVSFAALSVGHPDARYPLSIRLLRRGWYMLMFNHPEAEALLQRDDWRLFREWATEHYPDLDETIADLSRPGALTAGLNWYRANVPPAVLLSGPLGLPPVRVPVMGIFGMHDFALVEEQMTRSEQFCVAGWRYERFEASGHWLQLDEPERTNEVLLSFLTS